jgi:hypothetical protein
MDNSEFCDLILNCIMVEQPRNYEDFAVCLEYGERGYTQPEKGVILANWNNIPDNVAELFEECGYNLEWSDEWIIDYENSKCYRVSPDSYGWQPIVHYTDNGEILTPDSCIEEWLEEFSLTDHNQPMRALNSEIIGCYDNIDLESLGYTLFNTPEYESGMHSGQNDDPSSIAKNCFDTIQEIDHIVFVVTETSQFYIKFNCYYKCI